VEFPFRSLRIRIAPGSEKFMLDLNALTSWVGGWKPFFYGMTLQGNSIKKDRKEWLSIKREACTDIPRVKKEIRPDRPFELKDQTISRESQSKVRPSSNSSLFLFQSQKAHLKRRKRKSDQWRIVRLFFVFFCRYPKISWLSHFTLSTENKGLIPYRATALT